MHIRHHLFLASLAAGAAALASCGSQPRPDLTVTSWSPSTPVDRAPQIEVRFDRPVVTDLEVGGPVDPATIAVEPAVPWTGHWRDRQTLVLDPDEALRPATRYTVRLAGHLARHTGNFSFSFVHQPLVIDGLIGADPLDLDPTGDLSITFSRPVSSLAVATACKLVHGGDTVSLHAASATSGTTVAMRPAQALERDTDYTLRCTGLLATGGDAPMDDAATLALHTRPPLGVASITPVGQDVAADEVRIEVTLTSAVSLDAIRAAIVAEPAIPALAAGYLDPAGKVYTVVADLETDTDYEITVAGLVDLHGETLAVDATGSFHTGDASPRISMERGLYALEASAPGYAIWTRNVASYDVECARIPKDKLVQLLTGTMNYDPWGGNDDSAPLDWKALGVDGKKTVVTVEGARNKWHHDALDLGATCGGTSGQRGVYLADVSSADVAADPARPWWSPTTNRVLVDVTDLGVLLKVGPASGLVWVTSLSTGRPVKGAKVIVYTPQGKQVWVDRTDKDGLVKTPGAATMLEQPGVDDTDGLEGEDGEWEGDWDSYRSQRLIAVVEKDKDLAVVDGNWSNGIQIWNFGVPEERRGGVTQVRGFIQSDRGLYRPGETVHFKGIVREIAAGRAPRVPSRKPVAVSVTDARGATQFDGAVAMTRFGGWTFDLPIGTEAAVGDWYVTAKVGDRVFRERFLVEEFRAATFEVELEGQGDRNVRLGERLDLGLDARYLFGAPVADAQVAWNVSRRQHWLRFPGREQYTFEDNGDSWWWYEGDPDAYGEFVSDGEGVTDGKGHLGFVVRDPEPSLQGPYDYVISASVTDEADQTLSATHLVTAHQTDLYLGLHANEMVQAAGMPFGINVVAVKPDGTQVASKATLKLIRKVRDCVWETLAGRSYQRCTSRDEAVLDKEIEIAASGAHVERIFPEDPGDYLVRLEGKDSRGQPVVTSTMVWVIGKGEAFWSGDESDRMTLIASKAKYQPGDTARLVAQANLIAPTALITIERDGVLSARVQQLGAASEGVELTIQDAWAPNVFASVALVSGRQGEGDRHRPQFKMGVVELRVDTEAKHLQVQVTLDDAKVRPGAPVSGKVTVTRNGKPVAAELSLSVADEGVLQLIAYKTPDPTATFYATWGLGVDSGTNWNRLARIADPEAGDPDAGGDYGGSDGPKVRSRFLSTAYWAPALVTDARGEARFHFDAPDNLTAFRVMAVAADATDGFGAGDTRLTIDKPLMATPVLPRFVGAGDRLSIGVLVHNHTGKAGTAKVVAKADGLSLDGAPQEVDVPANGSARVRFAAKASQNASATMELAVSMNGERDALKISVPIRRPRVIDTATVARDGGSGDAKTVALGVRAETLRAESHLVISADRTGLGDLEPSLRYLVEYPYGCLEQTLSKFVPLAKAEDLSDSLGFASLDGTRADAFIEAGVAKVARHQQGDGNFSLWPQSQPYPHLTAYALWGLLEAKKAGVAVPAETMTNGLAALTMWLDEPATVTPDNQGATAAMAAYVVAAAGQPHAGALERLYAMRATLPRWGQAFLLRAMIASKSAASMIADVERDLLAMIKVTEGVADVTDDGGVDEFYFGSPSRSTAMVLAALIDRDPDHAMIPALVSGLQAMQRSDGRWENTQDNLWSLVALSDYARHAAPGSGTITVKAGSKVLAKKKLHGAEVFVIKQSLTGLDEITVSGDAGVRWTARVVQARVDDGKPVSNGFTVTRAYLDATGTAVTTLAAGEMVTVRLTVVVDTHTAWVALVDPLPAGLEAVNPALASADAGSSADGWEYSPWAETQVRDDRVQWFADQLGQGTYVMTYKARATIDGTFAVPPATIEAMYAPEHRGRTASTTMTVTK